MVTWCLVVTDESTCKTLLFDTGCVFFDGGVVWANALAVIQQAIAIAVRCLRIVEFFFIKSVFKYSG